ncbi:MAG: invasion associated locus B family protein [Micavibrio sp.]
MTIVRLSLLTLLLSLSVLISGGAHAAEPELLGNFGKWQAWKMDDTGGPVCYMLASPDKDSGAYKSRGKIYALITHRPGEGSKNVFSYIAGYTYKSGSGVKLQIGDKTFPLFTHEDTAWAQDATFDNAIAEAIRKGSSMVVTGTSSRGTLTTDTFSLKGSGGAHDAINSACGL